MRRTLAGLWHLIAVAVIAVWGTTFVSTKVLIAGGLSPTEIFTYRFAMAYAAMWCVARGRLWASSVKDELKLALLGLTGGSLYFITENSALEYTQAGNVSLLVCTAPVWTALLARVAAARFGGAARERVARGFWVGTAVALLGAGLVIFNGSFVLRLSPAGDLLSLAAAVSWALYSLLLRDLAGRYGIMFITRKVFVWGLATLVPFLALPGATYHLDALARPEVWANLLFLGLVASLGCFAVWNRVIRQIGVVRSSNYIYLNPVFTIATAALVLGERITWVAVAGLVFIALGLYVTERKMKSEKC